MPLDTSGSIRRVIKDDDVFLSPRVVDEGAFEDFAARLRKEIDRAGAEAGGVRELLIELKEAGERSARLLAQQQHQNEQIAALRGAVDAERERVEQEVSRAGGLNEAHKKFVERLDSTLAEREVEFSQRLDAGLERFCATLEVAVSEALKEVDERAARVEGQISRAVARFEETLGTRLAQAVENADTKINRSVERAHEQLSDVETARKTLEHQVEAVVGGALDDLKKECDRAEALIEGNEQLRTLQGNVEQATAVATRLAGVVDTARRSEERITGSLSGLNAQVDEAARRYVALEESLRKAIKASNSTEKLLSTSTDNVRHASTALDSVRARADQAVENLQRNAQHAESAAESGRAKQAQLLDTVQRAEKLLEKIEPWRSVLIAQSATGKLPEEMEQVVQKVRRGVLKEYMRGGKATPTVGEQVELKQDPSAAAVEKQLPDA